MKRLKSILATSVIVASVTGGALQLRQQPVEMQSIIVQGNNLAAVKSAVASVGGEITHELGIINAVGAVLSEDQKKGLSEQMASIRFYDGASRLQTAGNSNTKNKDEPTGNPFKAPAVAYPKLINATDLHDLGITGTGVTVAVLDTGTYDHIALKNDTAGDLRVLGGYNAITGTNDPYGDRSGHGTHVVSIAMRNKVGADGFYTSIAPDANLVSVKAFGDDGSGTYLNVIDGINWIVVNKELYDIRVLNLSLGATPRSSYWEDPLNQAVMAAWEAGIVVVASAGNTGPDPMTIGVPGNTPYVITVGAMSDNYTPKDPGDDVLASFSATGPTYDGFVKPELVAPGGHLVGVMEMSSDIVNAHPEFAINKRYYQMSGTSQSAAVVSGIAALMLQVNPNLRPDEVKCRLIASAQPALDSTGNLAYSPLQQGAGMINAYDAVEYDLDI